MEITPGQTCEDLFALLRRVKTALTELADVYNLTPVQVGALYAISEGRTSMGGVAGVMRCDASNVTGIIDRLVAQGLVIRQESAADRRAKILELTEEGQRITRNIVAAFPEVVGCQKLSPVQRAAMHEIIAKLAA